MSFTEPHEMWMVREVIHARPSYIENLRPKRIVLSVLW